MVGARLLPLTLTPTLTLHFQPQQWTCGAHLRVDGASGPGEVPGELLIAPWSLIRQPPAGREEKENDQISIYTFYN